MADSTPISALDMPAGDYAIVEALGHRTLIGRVAEVERFGTKMLQIEPLFGDVMLAPVLLGGGSIYQITPCSPDVAFRRRPTNRYGVPEAVMAIIPAAALPAPEPSFFDEDDDEIDHRTREERGINPL